MSQIIPLLVPQPSQKTRRGMVEKSWKPVMPQSESDRFGPLLRIPSQGMPKNCKIFHKSSQVWLEFFWLDDLKRFLNSPNVFPRHGLCTNSSLILHQCRDVRVMFPSIVRGGRGAKIVQARTQRETARADKTKWHLRVKF